MTNRISRYDLYFTIARAAAKRSTCQRKHIGAVIVPRRGVLLIGYNGAPQGLPHCLDAGCLIGSDGGCLRTQHAEANVIAWAARNGIALAGAEMFTTVSPCLSCAKMIINAGVESVLYLEAYREVQPLEYLKDARVHVDIYHPEKIDAS
jgi:dCMP deaminase